MTHELKTPVTSIRLHLETLKARGPAVDEAKRREFYDVMLKDSDRLMHLIEQVLSAGQKGRVPIQQVRIDLEGAGRRVHHADAIAAPSAGRGASHDRRRRTSRSKCMGDPDHLRGAMLNLLDNAVKYSREDVRVEVEVGEGRADLAVVRVRDQGIGIPPSETKRIFGRFYRTPWALTQRVKGTGLGLFIVAQTAKRHGGRAFAQSEGVGRGATFTLELPSAPHGALARLAPAHVQTAHRRRRSAHRLGASLSTSKPTATT